MPTRTANLGGQKSYNRLERKVFSFGTVYSSLQLPWANLINGGLMLYAIKLMYGVSEVKTNCNIGTTA